MSRSRIALLALALAALGGCRFKSWESFSSAVDPVVPVEQIDRSLVSDYTSEGIADASGGRVTDVSYTRGARNNQTSGFAPNDDAAKGSGQHPGELPHTARPGYGLQNGPHAQPGPESVGQPGLDSGRGY